MADLGKTPGVHVTHEAFHDDNEREHDGMVAELAPNKTVVGTLEERALSVHGRSEEDAMKLLMKGGMM